MIKGIVTNNEVQDVKTTHDKMFCPISQCAMCGDCIW